MSETALLRVWSRSDHSPALQEMKASLGKLGFDSIRAVRKCFIAALRKHKERMEARRDQARSHGERWHPSQLKFHWQRFLSKGVWQRRSEEYIQYMAASDLPDVVKDSEAERFKARQDPFARRLYQVTPWEPRLKLDRDDFLYSRSFFSGIPLVPPHESIARDGQQALVLAQPRCHMVNLKNQQCGRLSDCWGHHAFLCPCTSKQVEHNAMRDALNQENKAMGFFSSKEVPVAAWRKRPDNELVDPNVRF